MNFSKEINIFDILQNFKNLVLFQNYSEYFHLNFSFQLLDLRLMKSNFYWKYLKFGLYQYSFQNYLYFPLIYYKNLDNIK